MNELFDKLINIIGEPIKSVTFSGKNFIAPVTEKTKVMEVKSSANDALIVTTKPGKKYLAKKLSNDNYVVMPIVDNL